MESGLTRVQAEDGSFPYEQFQLDVSEDVFLTLYETIDGVETALDVSSATLEVHLRAKKRAGTTILNDHTMTKRSGGTTGKVSYAFLPTAANYDADDVCIMGVYLVDTAQPNAATPSTKVEKCFGLWQWIALDEIEGAGL